MNNYNFTNFHEDGLTIDLFHGLSRQKLNHILDSYFNELESNLNEFAMTFKRIFNKSDYDEFYYKAKSLIEDINDIKTILNIIDERYK